MKLESIDWNLVDTSSNCNYAYTMFHNTFLNCYHQCFPLRKVRFTYRNRKPWLSEGLKKSIKVKNKLYVHSIRKPSSTNCIAYKTYKHKLNFLLKQAEKNHYDSLMKRYQYNSRKSWAVIKEVRNKRSSKTVNNCFNINNSNVTDSSVIANEFNNFYVNIGPSLASKIPYSVKSPTDYIRTAERQPLVFEPVTNAEVSNIILNLKESSPGWDDVTAKVLKRTGYLYIEQLVHLFNLSLSQGIFPDQLKIAKVVCKQYHYGR